MYKSYEGTDFYNDVLKTIINSLSVCNYVDNDGIKSYKCEIAKTIYKFPYLNSDLTIKNDGDMLDIDNPGYLLTGIRLYINQKKILLIGARNM